MPKKTVVHVSPHPDDESIGAPCTLLALRDADWRVVNIVCSLGRRPDWERRQGEVEAATRIAEFENVVPDEPIRLSSGDDQRKAQRAIVKLLKPWMADPDVELVVGPHLNDGHHAHETVARAIQQSLEEAGRPIPWWMWGIWRDLPQPTMFVPCDPYHIELGEKMIGAYKGENARNSYRAMHRARRRVHAVLGAEQVFGFGQAHRTTTLGEARRMAKFAELLAEVSYRDESWMCGPPRQVEVVEPTTQWRIPTDDAGRRLLQPLLGESAAKPQLRRWFPRTSVPATPVIRRAASRLLSLAR